MASILQLLRRIGGAKAAPATGKAGELAVWKAGNAPTDQFSVYINDGTQWIEVIDSRTLWQVVGTNGVQRAAGPVGIGGAPAKGAAGASFLEVHGDAYVANIYNEYVYIKDRFPAVDMIATTGPADKRSWRIQAVGSTDNGHLKISPIKDDASKASITAIDITSDGFVGIGPGRAGAPLTSLDISGSACQTVLGTTGPMDLKKAQVFTADGTAGLTFSFVNSPANRSMTVALEIRNGGAVAQKWPASVKWSGGTPPSLTTGGIDVLTFITFDGGTTWIGGVFAKDAK